MEHSSASNTLYPAEDWLQDDDTLTRLLSSVEAYAAKGIGNDRTRAEHAAKVYLAFCLGLQKAGILSIKHAPHLWIDVGDTSFKVSTVAGCRGWYQSVWVDLSPARPSYSKQHLICGIFPSFF